MTRAEGERIARKLRSEGLTYRQIGERMGVHHKTVWGWVNESSEQSRARHRRCEEKKRGSCLECGDPMGLGAEWQGWGFCRVCYEGRQARRVEAMAGIVADLWADGLTLREIADELGTSASNLGVQIVKYRKRFPGLFPYRYNVDEGGRRVSAR